MRTMMKSLRKGLLAAGLVTPLLSTLPSNVSAQALKITTPSDLVSGGGALLRVDARAHVPTNDFVMGVNGPNVTRAFPADQSGRTLADLETNLQRGPDRRRARGRPDQRGTPCLPEPIKPGYNLDEAALLSNGWQRTFADSFGCWPLDLSKWTYFIGEPYNNELQYYQSGNVSIIDGSLQIKAEKRPPPPPVTGYDYTSGRIESINTGEFTGSDYKKVRIYARIKLPSDYGLWPAFWTYGDNWPTNGEIDILEAKVNEGIVPPTEYQTNYLYGVSANILITDPAATADQVLGVNLMDANYHVYMVEWTETQLKFSFDNAVVDTKVYDPTTADAYIPDLWDKTQHIVLNLAYGGDFVTSTAVPYPFVPGRITDGIMKVDWVKVFVKPLP